MDYFKTVIGLCVVGFLSLSFCRAQQKKAAKKGSAAVEILVKPYLQDVSPNSAYVMWETSSGSESVVEWGETEALGKETKGSSSLLTYAENRVHKVKLEGLKRFTTYYYRVRTGKVRSATYRFKTPPFARDLKSFNLLAMSDMQYDHNEPDKFREIVNEGILSYMNETYDGALSDKLAMVLIPGDLVEDGSKFFQWKSHFFQPAEPLFSQVPLYPVLGNHEGNSGFYFKYFSLPRNGTPAYDGHWWYKDYGNTRIIGLNSNKRYRRIHLQMDWFKEVLAQTAKKEEIDFVFVQLHHPHKSELWIPGEEDFSGEVVKLLENFTTETGKPSIHFFGHTHGYSRGQSRDHKHLWVNVASAGGAIDNWGEFEGRDYDEFTVTQDEYGFVMLEVDPNPENPKFTLKRISRGNTVRPKNNTVSDIITVYKKPQPPATPQAIKPKNETVTYIKPVLKANAFSSTLKNALHAASHWQISEDGSFPKDKTKNRWKQHENWYYLENRQKDDDLSDEMLDRLKPATTYYWRVRYRDQHLNWSKWSETSKFMTEDKK